MKAEQEKSWLRDQSTTEARGLKAPSSVKTVEPLQRPFSKPNCSVVSKVPTQEPPKIVPVSLNWPTVARFFWMKSAILLLDCKKKLLRVIQEGVIRRVGGQELIHIDVRIVSATNRDLAAEVQQGRFREDLFYRLNVINVHMPPLRDRGSDITLIARHFLDGLNEERGTDFEFDTEIEKHLLSHDWPGNIRQLQNEIRRIHALAGDQLNVHDFSDQTPQSVSSSSSQTATGLDSVIAAGSMKSLVEQLEKQWIAEALEKFGDRRGEVCKSLGIPKTTLYAKMKRYGLGS